MHSLGGWVIILDATRGKGKGVPQERGRRRRRGRRRGRENIGRVTTLGYYHLVLCVLDVFQAGINISIKRGQVENTYMCILFHFDFC